MARYLIVGNGWVGKKMYNEMVTNNHEVVITSHTEVFSYLENDNTFDYVINCAGVTGTPNVDACEIDKFNTMAGNAMFPILLYELCKKLNIKFAHFSSGCIYVGDINDVYADPNFFSSTYSISKGISDSYLKKDALVFRIRMPFSSVDEPKNLLTKLKNYAKNGKLIEGGKNSITDIDNAVKVACNLIETNAVGPYNLTNRGTVTTEEIINLLGISAEWYTPEEFKNITSCGRSNCTIPSYIEMDDVYMALQNAIAHMQNEQPE